VYASWPSRAAPAHRRPRTPGSTRRHPTARRDPRERADADPSRRTPPGPARPPPRRPERPSGRVAPASRWQGRHRAASRSRSLPQATRPPGDPPGRADAIPGTGPSRDRNARDRHVSLAGNPRSARSLGAKYRTGVYLCTSADQAQLLSVIQAQPSAAALPIICSFVRCLRSGTGAQIILLCAATTAARACRPCLGR